MLQAHFSVRGPLWAVQYQKLYEQDLFGVVQTTGTAPTRYGYVCAAQVGMRDQALSPRAGSQYRSLVDRSSHDSAMEIICRLLPG
jgi:hypothetical protein